MRVRASEGKGKSYISAVGLICSLSEALLGMIVIHAIDGIGCMTRLYKTHQHARASRDVSLSALPQACAGTRGLFFPRHATSDHASKDRASDVVHFAPREKVNV